LPFEINDFLLQRNYALEFGFYELTNPIRDEVLPVTPEERERMTMLCERIAAEQDRNTFMQLVDQLSELLDHREERITSNSSASSRPN